MNFLQLAEESEKLGVSLDLHATQTEIQVTLTDSKTSVPVVATGETVEEALAKIIARLTWGFL